MQLSENIRAMRITGTLDVELEDGRTATMEVDLDVSDPRTTWGVDGHYDERARGPVLALGGRYATTYSVTIPTSLRREDGGATWTLRVPVDGDE